MARPESIADIKAEQIEFATVDVNLIANRGDYLKAYAMFMEAVQNLGGEVSVSYGSRTTFTRPPTDKDLKTQLTAEQTKWDERQKYYEQLRDVGDVEYSHQRTYAQQHVESEGLPWPPEHDPISDFHKVIADIDTTMDGSF